MKSYDAIAFDGCYFYMLENRKTDGNIDVLDRGFRLLCKRRTYRVYTSFTYDSVENIFLAVDESNFVYKLNMYFQEFDLIPFNHDEKEPIKNIAFDCQRNLLLAACGDVIYQISKAGEVKGIIACLPSVVGSVVAVPPYVVFAISDGLLQAVIVEYPQHPNNFKKQDLPFVYRVIDLVYDPCREAILIFVMKNKYEAQMLSWNLHLSELACCAKNLCLKEKISI